MQATSDTRPRKFVFTLMPFSEAFDDIYKLGIKSACESAGSYCERIDEQIFNENILLRLYNQINKADLIVSDMTGRNPNVFYETGYAHALNKKVILLTQVTDDIPFDLKHYPHIVYSGKIAFLKDELQRRVQWYLDQPDQVIRDWTSLLKYYMRRKLIENDSDIPLESDGVAKLEGDARFQLDFTVHNPTFHFIDAASIYYSFIVTEEFLTDEIVFSHIADRPPIQLPNGNWLLETINFPRLIPQGWESHALDLHWSSRSIAGEARPHPMVLRITSENGVKDIRFNLVF